MLGSTLLAAACGGPRASEVAARWAEEATPRVAITRALERGGARPGAARGSLGEAARPWVAAALEQRPALYADPLLREAVRALAPSIDSDEHTPLARARALEDAAASLAQGADTPARTRALAARGEDRRASALGLTGARAALVLATLDEPKDLDKARRWLDPVKAARPPGILGAGAAERAMLLSASLDHRAGDYQDAIRDYLRVGASSPHWRAARLGLAWCQLRRGRPERTLKILALLPGGLTGDPERASLAAMAAHGLGDGAAAQLIVAEALARAPAAWSEAEVDPEAVLALVEASGPGGGVRLRDPEEGLLATLAWSSSVRGLGLELLTTREEAQTWPELEVRAVALEARFREALETAAGHERRRAEAALRDLEVLAPQLAVPLDPTPQDK